MANDTYIVDAQLYIKAESVEDAVAYGKRLLAAAAESDIEQVIDTTTDPWLVDVAVDNRAEVVRG